MSGNALSWLALFSWPVVALVVFSSRKQTHRLARTTAWMMLLPTMFLPSNMEYDPPALPPFDKHRLAFLSIAIALHLFHRPQLLRNAPGQNFPRIILAVLMFGAFLTAATNGDALVFGPKVLPGLTPYDGVSMCIGLVLDCYLPFVIGQRVFRTERDLRDLLEVLVTCAFIYIPLILLEARLSPQLHYWVYGYYPSDFIQAIRGGAFRPIVFMNHGLSVAMWTFSCLCAVLALNRGKAKALAVWVGLALCRSMAPVIYGGLVTFFKWIARPKIGIKLIIACVAVVSLYPITRGSGTFPADEILEFFRGIDQHRAASLQFRFDNEDQLLARANLRPVFGWGGYARSHVWTEWGQDISVTDGYWIIMIGMFGYVGWAGFFALLIGPLWRYLRNYERVPASARELMSAFAVMMAVFTLDLLPNARSDFLPVAYAGVLWTLSERLTRKVPRRVSVTRPVPHTLPGRLSSG